MALQAKGINIADIGWSCWSQSGQAGAVAAGPNGAATYTAPASISGAKQVVKVVAYCAKTHLGIAMATLTVKTGAK